jgi:uncharacterized membrane protein YesL
MKKREIIKKTGHKKGEITHKYKEEQIDALKALVLRKHQQWRKPKHAGFLKFYLLLVILIAIGIYLMVGDRFKMSSLSTEITYLFTALLVIATMIAIFHHYKLNCQENIEEKVENEVLRFLHEKKEGSRL